MNKGKFASLILLGAFSAGVASSSTVSAQGDGNLASTVDISIGSHDESAVAFDETNIDAETTTDEETQGDSIDDNSEAGINAENINDNPENKTDLSENSAKENNKNEDYLFVDDEKQNVKKGNGVETVKGFAIAGTGAIMVGSATSVISKLVKSSGNDKKDEPKPEPKPEPEPEPSKKEEKGGFIEWYKNNLRVSIPSTIFFLCISLIIGRMVYKRIHPIKTIIVINELDEIKFDNNSQMENT